MNRAKIIEYNSNLKNNGLYTLSGFRDKKGCQVYLNNNVRLFVNNSEFNAVIEYDILLDKVILKTLDFKILMHNSLEDKLIQLQKMVLHNISNPLPERNNLEGLIALIIILIILICFGTN